MKPNRRRLSSSFEAYTQAYRSLEIGLAQAELGMIGASESFKGFPLNLPPPLQLSLAAGLTEYARILRQYARTKRSKGAEGASLPFSDESEPVHDIVDPFVRIALLSGTLPQHVSRIIPDFQPLIASQYLFVLFACADAFTEQTIRSILTVCPERLRTQNQITWNEALETGSWKDLLNHMRDQTCMKFGFQCLADRAIELRDRLGVGLTMEADCLDQVREAELERNLLMHAGGYANAEYIKRSPKPRFKLGQKVVVTCADVSAYIHAVNHLCAEIFRAVAVHFHKATRTQIDSAMALYRPPHSRIRRKSCNS